MIQYNGPALLDQRKLFELASNFACQHKVPMTSSNLITKDDAVLSLILLLLSCEMAGIDLELAFIQFVEGRLE